MRSHSSDLLKRSPYDIITKKSHFNSLKEWGRSRLRLINRSPSDSGRDSRTDKPKATNKSPTVQDIDDVNIYETVTMRRRKNGTKQQDRKISHERNNSYSSSEKSMGVPISVPVGALAVKLRESTAAARRRRAATTATTTGPVKEEPHSSSGNWSQSSESGRTSIGSEITSTTAAPRSSTSAATSSNSLNIPHGPPSSIVSRRRFLNTSGSGSVTSEGTLTPDIIHDLHDDMETSSEYSCDTEGYYTSFHMDSGLKTLKEEEISLPITPLHTTNTFTNSSSNQTNMTAENEYELFGKGSTSTTTSSAGTVCTTLLAAGSDRSLVLGPTVPERKSSLSKLNKSWSSSTSSTDKNSTANIALSSERMNTIKRNTLPKTSTQLVSDSSQNKSLPPQESGAQETVVAVVHQTQVPLMNNTGAESPDSGHNTSSSPVDDSMSSAHGGKLSCGGSELDYSESSDLEGVDRIERIRVKTTINSSRIPSMCVITPHNSDDESIKSSIQESPEVVDRPPKKVEMSTFKPREPVLSDLDDLDVKQRISSRPRLDLPLQETDLDTIVFNDNVSDITIKNVEPVKLYITEEESETPEVKHSILTNILSKKYKAKKQTSKRPESQKNTENRKSSFMPLNNLMCKLKDVFPQKLKKSSKDSNVNESLYTDNGEYVTIADVRNNNQKVNIKNTGGVYYSNDVVKRNLQTVLSGKLHETEYVSLNELPSNISTEDANLSNENTEGNAESAVETFIRHGARVTLDSDGKVIYSSDSLRRRKGAHTTFEPGPFVKDITDGSSMDITDSPNVAASSSASTLDVLKNTTNQRNSVPREAQNKHRSLPLTGTSRPLSPQLGKLVIRAPNAASNNLTPTSEVVRLPPSNIVSPNSLVRPMSPRAVAKGAYVNMQDAEGISLSPIKDNDPGKVQNGQSISRLPGCLCRNVHSQSCHNYCVSNNMKITSPRPTSLPPNLPDKSKHGSKGVDLLKLFASKNSAQSNKLTCDNVVSNTKLAGFSKVVINLLNDSKDSSSVRKVKRSDSYKMANSPMMPIKRLLNVESFGLSKTNTKSIELIESEIAADLLRNKINYPATVSPKLCDKMLYHSELNNIKFRFRDDLDKCDNLGNFRDEFESKLTELSLSPLNTPLYSRPRTLIKVQNVPEVVTEDEMDSDFEEGDSRPTPYPYVTTPNKVTMPNDGFSHRARVLSVTSHFDTEIW